MVFDFSTIRFDADDNLDLQPLILANPDKTPIGTLGYAHEIKPVLRYSDISELSFTVPSHVSDRDSDDYMRVPYYDKIVGKRLIYLHPYGWFRLENPTIVGDGISEKKECYGESLECEFKGKYINGLDGTFKFYDFINPDNTILGMVLERLPSWSVGEIDDELTTIFRTFSINNQNAYQFLMQEVQKDFQCIITFDTNNRTVNAKLLKNITHQSTAYLSFDNVNKSVKINEQSEQIVTCLQVFGATEDVNIRAVNPRGDNKIYNLDYFMSSDWLPQTIVDKWIAYKTLFDASQRTYGELRAQLRAQNAILLTQMNKLIDLQNERKVIENAISLNIGQGITDHTALNNELIANALKIDSQDAMIASTEQNINSINAQLADIHSSLQFDAHFTQDEWKLLDAYVYEDTLQNDTFVYVDNARSNLPDMTSAVYGGSFTSENGVVAVVSDNADNTIYDLTSGKFSVQWTSDGTSFTLSGDIRYGNVYIYKTSDNYVVSATVNGCTLTSGSGSIQFDVGEISLFGKKTSVSNTASSIDLAYGESNIYITEQITENQKTAISQELYDYANDVLSKASEPMYEFNVDSANFVFLKEYFDMTKTIKSGSSVALEIRDGYVVYPVILEVNLNYEDESDFSIVFGNKFRLNSPKFALTDLFEQSIVGGSNMSFGRYDFENYKRSGDKTNVRKFMDSALNASTNALISNDNQEIEISSSGLRARKYNPITGKFDDEQMWIANNVLAFSDDGFQTSKLAIGKFHDTNVGTTWGIVAPSIVGTLLAGENLVIEAKDPSDQTVQFRVDGSGATLTNAMLTVQNDKNRILLDPINGFRIQKRTGLALYEDKFYVDTNGNLHFAGTLTGADGAFSGTVSAATITGSTITGGTINIGTKFSVSADGTISATGGNFSGTINGSVIIGGSVIGSSISVGSNFSVDSNGNMTATNGKFSGTITGTDIIGGKLASGDGAVWLYCQNSSGIQRLEFVSTSNTLFMVSRMSSTTHVSLNGATSQITHSGNISRLEDTWYYSGMELGAFARTQAGNVLYERMFNAYSASGLISVTALSDYVFGRIPGYGPYPSQFVTQSYVDNNFVRK